MNFFVFCYCSEFTYSFPSTQVFVKVCNTQHLHFPALYPSLLGFIFCFSPFLLPCFSHTGLLASSETPQRHSHIRALTHAAPSELTANRPARPRATPALAALPSNPYCLLPQLYFISLCSTNHLTLYVFAYLVV